MRNRNDSHAQVWTTEGIRSSSDLGAKVRHLHKDYKLALAMTLAGKSDAEIVAKLDLDHIDEDDLKKNMAWLLKHLGADSFTAPVFQTRPVRRALKDYWMFDFESGDGRMSR